MVNLGVINHSELTGSYPDDIQIERINEHSKVNVTSLTGSITIVEKIDQHCQVYLRAKRDINIFQKIDQHSRVTLHADRNIKIFESIDQHCRTEFFIHGAGNVVIDQKVNETSYARITVPNGTITIGEGVDQHSVVDYFCVNPPGNGHGGISRIDNGSKINLSPVPLEEINIWQENPD